ncbi:hypothetical protein CORC01_10809 [Colletotrichum orchidophilum]|uniref:Uncharacterized protein n=1 Tax=Colletotrichum orchidophilum TaxID=1209926 RepID=A0A1G4AXM1_9PEZI|nr:uncharacterized protein CORC01_10809 [Colletotrichum orchidophilum]OHE93910.1 hypothetical protein CORC01_10809 [Colletotrichum orchidophilum]
MADNPSQTEPSGEPQDPYKQQTTEETHTSMVRDERSPYLLTSSAWQRLPPPRPDPTNRSLHDACVVGEFERVGLPILPTTTRPTYDIVYSKIELLLPADEGQKNIVKDKTLMIQTTIETLINGDDSESSGSAQRYSISYFVRSGRGQARAPPRTRGDTILCSSFWNGIQWVEGKQMAGVVMIEVHEDDSAGVEILSRDNSSLSAKKLRIADSRRPYPSAARENQRDRLREGSRVHPDAVVLWPSVLEGFCFNCKWSPLDRFDRFGGAFKGAHASEIYFDSASSLFANRTVRAMASRSCSRFQISSTEGFQVAGGFVALYGSAVFASVAVYSQWNKIDDAMQRHEMDASAQVEFLCFRPEHNGLEGWCWGGVIKLRPDLRLNATREAGDQRDTGINKLFVVSNAEKLAWRCPYLRMHSGIILPMIIDTNCQYVADEGDWIGAHDARGHPDDFGYAHTIAGVPPEPPFGCEAAACIAFPSGRNS